MNRRARSKQYEIELKNFVETRIEERIRLLQYGAHNIRQIINKWDNTNYDKSPLFVKIMCVYFETGMMNNVTDWEVQSLLRAKNYWIVFVSAGTLRSLKPTDLFEQKMYVQHCVKQRKEMLIKVIVQYEIAIAMYKSFNPNSRLIQFSMSKMFLRHSQEVMLEHERMLMQNTHVFTSALPYAGNFDETLPHQVSGVWEVFVTPLGTHMCRIRQDFFIMKPCPTLHQYYNTRHYKLVEPSDHGEGSSTHLTYVREDDDEVSNVTIPIDVTVETMEVPHDTEIRSDGVETEVPTTSAQSSPGRSSTSTISESASLKAALEAINFMESWVNPKRTAEAFFIAPGELRMNPDIVVVGGEDSQSEMSKKKDEPKNVTGQMRMSLKENHSGASASSSSTSLKPVTNQSKTIPHVILKKPKKVPVPKSFDDFELFFPLEEQVGLSIDEFEDEFIVFCSNYVPLRRTQAVESAKKIIGWLLDQFRKDEKTEVVAILEAISRRELKSFEVMLFNFAQSKQEIPGLDKYIEEMLNKHF